MTKSIHPLLSVVTCVTGNLPYTLGLLFAYCYVADKYVRIFGIEERDWPTRLVPLRILFRCFGLHKKLGVGNIVDEIRPVIILTSDRNDSLFINTLKLNSTSTGNFLPVK